MAVAKVNGVELVYNVRGEGEPVLFICGTSQRAGSWNEGLRPLVDAQGFRTIVYDNRGIPPSSCPPPPWSVQDMADDAIGLLESVGGGPFQFHLVGASLGALIAQNLALRRPDLVRSVVFFVGGGSISPTTALLFRSIIELYERRMKPPAGLMHWLGLHAALSPQQLNDDAVVNAAVGPEGSDHSAFQPQVFGPGGQYGQLSAVAGWSRQQHLNELEGLRCPCVFIAAEHDIVFPIRYLRAAATRAPFGELVELPGAPHASADPHTGQLVGVAIVSFLQRQRGSRASVQ